MKVCWQCQSSVPDNYRYCLSCGADIDSSPSQGDPLVGRILVDKYRLVEQLGSGAMGTIYKADQLALGKEIVIKLLHTHLMGDADLVQRFHREAKAASRLNHPHCVQIIDFGQTAEGSLYIAMEYIPGVDLATVLEDEYPVDHLRLVRILKQVCSALDEAHANGVLHRDLKPENIMIADRRNEKDFVKVVDFGIAKLEDNNPNSKRSFQTRTGIVCGTPEYMSPEQARGKELDGRSDIYALGVAVYHMVTDRLPFDGDSPIEIVTQHLSDRPVAPSQYRADLPQSLERLILSMLEKDREKRPTTIMDVNAELERIERELMLERREAIPQRLESDATMIDVPKVAIMDALRGAQESPTEEWPAERTAQARARIKAVFAGNAGLAAPTGDDTMPDSPAKSADTDRRSRKVRKGRKDDPTEIDEAPLPDTTKNVVRPAAAEAFIASDQATVNTAAVPAPAHYFGDEAFEETRHGQAAIAPATRGTKLWLIVLASVLTAAALGVGAWLLVDALN